MDPDLRHALGEADLAIEFLDDTGRVKLPNGTEYVLKPLSALFEPGATEAKHEAQLQHVLESGILEYDHHAGLTDSDVLLTLDPLATNPEAAPRDALAKMLQLRLRAYLSVNACDRQTVRVAVRRVQKSVQQHTRRGGERTYLDAIHDRVPLAH
jgi:hypothetical protein